MKEDLENAKRLTTQTITDVLRGSGAEAANIDVQAACEVIVAFVFQDQEEPDDTSRCEWFYCLIGKAATIAQAWKLNCVNDLKHQNASRASLVSYIEKTYGVTL